METCKCVLANTFVVARALTQHYSEAFNTCSTNFLTETFVTHGIGNSITMKILYQTFNKKQFI